MAILKVTQQMIEDSKRPAEGWYELELSNIVDKAAKPKPGKPQTVNCFGDINFLKDLQTGADLSDRGKGRKDQYLFNYSYATMEADFICAALGIPSLEVIADKEIDIAAALNGRKLQGHVVHYIYEQKEQWKFDRWLPEGTSPF
jgi:hypothetical protein